MTTPDINQLEKSLSGFYLQYIEAFAKLSIEQVQMCYQLPSTLSTPEKVVLLANENVFAQEFTKIFDMIAQEKVTGFKTSNASFDIISDNLLLVAMDWRFYTQANNLFTEFTAIYHLTIIDGNYKIINVMSQDTSQAITLTNAFTITLE